MRGTAPLLALLLVACTAPLPTPVADVVVVGEYHGTADHHATQARIAREIAPTAIVFEQLSPADESTIADLRAREAGVDEIASALGWADRGWPDLALYATIWDAAPDARVLGSERPRDDVRRSVQDGAAAVFGADAARYGLNRALDPAEQAAREAEQFTVHCDALPRELLPGMVQAQRLRDAALAQAALRAFETLGGPVLVVTGNGHARADWGVPAVLARAAPALEVEAVGQGLGDQPPPGRFDRLVFAPSPPVPAPDPCGA